MDQRRTTNVTFHCACIPVGFDSQYLVSRPVRDSWLKTESQQIETLLFSNSGVYVVNTDENVLGRPLELWQRNPDSQPYGLSFPANASELCGSAVWDPWMDRVLFTYGGSEVLCIHGDSNETSLLVDFAQALEPAPATCDFLALDPQRQGRLWVVTAAEENSRDGGGAVYELDLRSSVPSTVPVPELGTSSSSHQSEKPTAELHLAHQHQHRCAPPSKPPPAAVQRVAQFSETLRAATFDAARRCLLVATQSEIYSIPVDGSRRWRYGADADAEPELLMGAGTGAAASVAAVAEPRLQADGDGDSATLNGIVGLTCDGVDGGNWYVVEEVRIVSARRRGVTSRSSVRRLELSTTSAGTAGATTARLTTVATADGASWRSPCVLSNGCLALLDPRVGAITLLSLGLQPPCLGTLRSQPAEGHTTAAACAAGASAVPAPRRRTLAADLSALLDNCQGSDGVGSGSGGDVTLIAARGVELRAHGAILAARCDYFAPLLGNGSGCAFGNGSGKSFGDSGTQVVRMEDVDAGVLRGVLRYIYTGFADLDLDLELSLDPQQEQQQRVSPQQRNACAGPVTEDGGGGGTHDGDGGGEVSNDPLHALAEVADRLLLPELSLAAQRRVLQRAATNPGKHLVIDLMWAARRGFGFARLLVELKELYLQHTETLARLERAHEPRRRGHGHGHGRGIGGESGGGGRLWGPRRLAAGSPELAAELELVLAARKRRRGA